MKKRDIWITLSIVAVAVLVIWIHFSHFSWQPKGYIQIAPINNAQAEMKLEAGIFGGVMKITSANGAIPVAARAYKPKSIYVTAKQDNNTWQLRSFGPWGSLRRIEVVNGETTIVKAGPPFKLKTDVTKSAGIVSIGLTILGQSGERYHPAIQKNSGKMSVAIEPTVTILDEKDNILASGKFAYG